MQTINWGILGIGRMAEKFAHDLQLVSGARIYAVASRSEQRANQFAQKFDVQKAYSSYEELVKDPAIDIVYIATRHPQHVENSLLALNHNKNVLCEKPMAMNATQAKGVLELAKEKQLFFMEGIWTRFFPMTQQLLNLLEGGLIGNMKLIQADFGFVADPNKERLFDKSLGGGSLLDIGLYPLYISLLTMGMPKQIFATANFAETGVDQSCTMLFNYGDAMANLSSTLAAFTPGEAWFHGNKGSLKLHCMFHEATQLSFYKNGQLQQTWSEERLGLGYTYEIEHVHQCLQEKRSESPLLSHSISLQLMQLLDRVREEIGLEYE